MGYSFGGRDVRKVNGKEKVYYAGSQQEAKDEGECWVVPFYGKKEKQKDGKKLTKLKTYGKRNNL